MPTIHELLDDIFIRQDLLTRDEIGRRAVVCGVTQDRHAGGIPAAAPGQRPRNWMNL